MSSQPSEPGEKPEIFINDRFEAIAAMLDANPACEQGNYEYTDKEGKVIDSMPTMDYMNFINKLIYFLNNNAPPGWVAVGFCHNTPFDVLIKLGRKPGSKEQENDGDQPPA